MANDRFGFGVVGSVTVTYVIHCQLLDLIVKVRSDTVEYFYIGTKAQEWAFGLTGKFGSVPRSLEYQDRSIFNKTQNQALRSSVGSVLVIDRTKRNRSSNKKK